MMILTNITLFLLPSLARSLPPLHSLSLTWTDESFRASLLHSRHAKGSWLALFLQNNIKNGKKYARKINNETYCLKSILSVIAFGYFRDH